MSNLQPVRKAGGVSPLAEPSFENLAGQLSEVGRGFYARGWVLGTSGNFSAVVSQHPVRLAITSTGLDKGRLSQDQFLEIDGSGTVLRGEGKPSAETLLHLMLVREFGAKAVLHTHSTWSTVLSGWCAAEGGVAIENFEMLKGLSGVQTHQHREWLPIVENSQNIEPLARIVAERLRHQPQPHGFLLREHGLYTWGASIDEAKRHIEILEFLMEVLVRRSSAAHL